MMLVEINLLPKKDPKKFGFILLFALIIVLVILTAAFYLWQIHVTKLNIQSTQKQISQVEKATANQSKYATASIPPNSVDRLKNGINQMNNLRIPTIPVMVQLTSLLPERGFIQSFQYAGNGIVTLTVQFDTESEAAYYLASLNQSKWVEAASLASLMANSNDTPPASSTNTNVNSSSDNNISTIPNTNNSDSQSKSNVIPRYVGEFVIKMSRDYIKKNSESSNEGVTGQ